jgi:hypothetical protein
VKLVENVAVSAEKDLMEHDLRELSPAPLKLGRMNKPRLRILIRCGSGLGSSSITAV